MGGAVEEAGLGLSFAAPLGAIHLGRYTSFADEQSLILFTKRSILASRRG